MQKKPQNSVTKNTLAKLISLLIEYCSVNKTDTENTENAK